MKIINFGKTFFLKLIIIFLLNLFCNNYVFAQQISQENFLNFPEIDENFSKPSRLGSYNLKVWSFNVYNIQLLSETKNFSYQNKSALVINYQRDFAKKDLIQKSLEEISRINNINDEALLKKYQNKLEEIFFDVKEGDRKTAFFNPKNGVKLYSFHEGDCCESHELYLEDLTLDEFNGLEFDLTNDNFFKRIPDYGIELIPIYGHSVKIAGHGYNNGFYSDQLELVIEKDGDIIKRYDITECQTIEG